MSLSDKLASLNVARYEAWSPQFTADNARQAVLAFNGDVYEGLQARSLSPAELDWAQQHLAILSGLYGVLRPLDLLQPYRLEMGTRLAHPAAAPLPVLGPAHRRVPEPRLQADASPVVVNLASQEYFKSVDLKVCARVIECVFEDFKGGAYKIISFHAKRARGLMARYAITERLTRPASSKASRWKAMRTAAASTPERLVFRRRLD
jgi:cytoplasmic iron level regulating protein YaaA (DUF328/UPF0246 family)